MKELKLDAKTITIEVSAYSFKIEAMVYTKDNIFYGDTSEEYDLIRIGAFNQKILIRNAKIINVLPPELSHWTIYTQKVTIQGESFSVHWKPSISIKNV